jgi:hypothetical protein
MDTAKRENHLIMVNSTLGLVLLETMKEGADILVSMALHQD